MKRAVFAIFAALLIFSCGQEPLPESGQDNPAPAGKETISLMSDASMVVPADGLMTDIVFKASGSWTATVSGDWISLSPKSGDKGDRCVVTIDIKGNNTDQERSATITVKCGGASVSVTVTQVEKDALVLSPSSREIGGDGGELTFEATSNVDITVQVADSWVKLVQTKAMSTKTYTFSVDPNTVTEERSTTITFSGETVSQTVTVIQAEGKGFIADFKPEYKLSAREQTLTLAARANVEISAESQVDWIRVADTKAMEGKSITLLVSANDGASRTGTVTVKAEEAGTRQNVTIVQTAAGEFFIPDTAFLSLLLSVADYNGDGTLSKEECEKVSRIYAWGNPIVNDIESFEGLEFFPNLSELSLYTNGQTPPAGKARGTLDLSANHELAQLQLGAFPYLEKIDLSGCPKIWGIDLGGDYENKYFALTELVLPDTAELPLNNIRIQFAPRLGPSLDLTSCFDLQYVSVYDCQLLSKVILPTGIPVQTGNIEGPAVEYRGPNFFEEATFLDPVLKQVLTAADPYHLDYNNDGVITPRDLSKVYAIDIWDSNFAGIDGNITTLEDVALFTNATRLWIRGECGERVRAPLPEALSSLDKIGQIIIENCKVSGTIPESYSGMTKLFNFTIENTDIHGGFPEFLLRLPELRYLSLMDNPGLTGTVNLSIPKNTKLDYVYLRRCNFDTSVIICDTAEELLNQTSSNVSINFSPQLGGEAKLLYRLSADGKGAVHADGEAVRYHSATKGPGLDIFLTGDGFTAAGNTVGGTLEAYLTYAAETIKNTEPFNKLIDYFNIWLVYAHSQQEGTAINDESTASLKFGTSQPMVGQSSTCLGDYDTITGFVKAATERMEPSGTVGVIMNSPNYGGMCMMRQDFAVGLIPASSGFALTFVHEVMGHGFAKLGDEYDADTASSDQSGASGTSQWTQYGFYSNIDNESDPAKVRWHAFLTDSRYASEGLGVFEGANLANTGWYRPSQNSIMNHQNAEGGDRFNAPSREAIWQRVQVLTHPEQTWTDWSTYVANGYNREDFVEFDLAPDPNPAATMRVREALRKASASTPGISPTPPVIITPEE